MAAIVAVMTSPAYAETSWLDDAMLSLEIENDFFTPHGSDRHYTNGVRLEALSRPIGGSEVPDWSREPYAAWPGFELSAMRRVGFALGQNIYTPADTDSRVPDPKDRPYAAWAYLGVMLASETPDRLDTVELDLGVVGPAAGGRFVQNQFHNLINVPKANGWGFQLHNEPGAILSAERRWRLSAPPILQAGIEADAIPIIGASVGNVMTYANAGLMLRLGQGLRADFGPPRIRPSLPGSPAVGDTEGGIRLVPVRRLRRAGGGARHLPRRQHVSGQPERAEEAIRRRFPGRARPADRVRAHDLQLRCAHAGISWPVRAGPVRRAELYVAVLIHGFRRL